ncbi:MAG: GAF domain-containing sensor histidine kinase [bacterium]
MESATSISLDTQELEKLNQEIYKQNVQLSIRNRTLSILQKVYKIINETLGVKDTSEELLSAMVTDLGFQLGFIALIDRSKNQLVSEAMCVSNSLSPHEFEKSTTVFKSLKIPISKKDNFCIQSITENKKRLTNSLYDILVSYVEEKEAIKLQEKLNIQTSILFPLVFANQKFGILVLCMDKHVGFLSRTQSETLKELIGVVSIAIERAQIYMDLKEANTRLKALDKLKDDFVSLVSHELRTPLTAIKGYAWLMVNKKQDVEKQKVYMDRIYTSTERLIHLVNNMLDVSRIETGRMEFKSEKMDLAKLACAVKEEISARATQKGIEIKVLADKGFFVKGDIEKLREVLLNLVGNALKFTPQGGKVRIEFTQEEKFVKCSVIDTGVGIKKEDLSKLFSKFGRLNNSFSSMSEIPGTGLGLFICKKIVEQLKGKIWVESEFGHGSKFIFLLPM